MAKRAVGLAVRGGEVPVVTAKPSVLRKVMPPENKENIEEYIVLRD